MSKSSKRIKTWLGKKHTSETKEKMSKSGMGHFVSDETKEKISKINKGRIGCMLGKHHSKETKNKISLSHIGKKVSEETKIKTSRSCQGKNLGNNKYVGVRQEKRNLKETWVACIKGKHLGSFDTEEEAARHYDQWALILYGEDAKLNFEDSRINKFEVFENKKKGKNFKSSSQYYGVSFLKDGRRFSVSTRVNNIKKWIGTYKNEIDAAKAYDEFIIENKLDKPLNFPEDWKNKNES